MLRGIVVENGGVGRRRGLFGCYDCGPFIFACVHVKG